MSHESEKRRQARVPVGDEILIRDTISGKELGVLANVNEEGFMAISDGGLREDHLYQIALELEPNNGDTSISMGVECLWISDTGTGDQVWAGFQIMEMSDPAKGIIERLIQKYQKESED